jgi:hypothetical protein
MLVVMFTVLPLQTSAVVNAITARSPYQRKRYRPAGDGAHVVVAAPSGLTGEAAERVAGTLLSPARLDQGSLLALVPKSAATTKHATTTTTPLLSAASYGRVVFLCPHPPDARTRALLKSSQGHRVKYLQGSCLRPGDLSRAAVGSATAVVLLADERSDDPHAHDLMQGAALLTLGHALQARDKAEAREAAHYARRYAGLAAIVVAGASGPTSGGARALVGFGLSRRLALAVAAQLLRLTLGVLRLRDWLLLRPEPTYVAAARRAQRAALHAARAAASRARRSDGGGGGVSSSASSSPAASAAAAVMAAAAAAALRPPTPPRVLVQLLLPESRGYLQQMLREMIGGGGAASSSRRSRPGAATTSGGGGTTTTTTPSGLFSERGSLTTPLPRADTDGGAGSAAPGGLERLVELATGAMLRHARGGGGGAAAAAVPVVASTQEKDDDDSAHFVDPERPLPREPARSSARSLLRLKPVPPFWRRFGGSVSVVCAAELRAAMLALSASPSGAPGAAALLSNLVRPCDGGALPPDGGPAAAAAPPSSSSSSSSFADGYLRGAQSGLHGVRRLPRHLSGQPFARVAVYAHACFGAAIVALVERRRGGGGRRGRAEDEDEEEEEEEEEQEDDDDRDGFSDQDEEGDDAENDESDDDSDDDEEEEPALVLAPLPTGRRVRRRSGALVIAPDARAAAALATASREHYERWRRDAQCGAGKVVPRPHESSQQTAAAAAELPSPSSPPPQRERALSSSSPRDALPPAFPPVLASARHLSGHLLICGGDGTRPSVLLSAALPLRASSSPVAPAPPPPIVILDRRRPAPDEDDPDGAAAWARLAALGDVFFVQGTAAHPDDLRRAGADAAAGAVVLCRAAPRSASSAGDGAGDGVGTGSVEARVLDDADALRRARLLRSVMRPSARVCVELWLASSCLGLGGLGSLAAAAAAAAAGGGGGGVGAFCVMRRQAGDVTPAVTLLRATTTLEYMAGTVALSAGLGEAVLSLGLQSGREGVAFVRRLLLPPSSSSSSAHGDGDGDDDDKDNDIVTLELREIDDLARTPTYGDLFAELVSGAGPETPPPPPLLLPLGLSRRAAAPTPGSDWAAPRRWAERAAAAALGLGGKDDEDRSSNHQARPPRPSPLARPRAALRYVHTAPPAGERLERGDRVFVLVRKRR